MRGWWRSRRSLQALLDREQRASALRIRELLEENERLEAENRELSGAVDRMLEQLLGQGETIDAYEAKLEHLQQQLQQPKETQCDDS